MASTFPFAVSLSFFCVFPSVCLPDPSLSTDGVYCVFGARRRSYAVNFSLFLHLFDSALCALAVFVLHLCRFLTATPPRRELLVVMATQTATRRT